MTFHETPQNTPENITFHETPQNTLPHTPKMRGKETRVMLNQIPIILIKLVTIRIQNQEEYINLVNHTD